jgi:hypothetical protein
VAGGAAAGVLVVVALALLVAGLFGASPVPLPGLPDLGRPVQPSAPALVTNPENPPRNGSPTPSATPGPSATSSPGPTHTNQGKKPSDTTTHGRP